MKNITHISKGRAMTQNSALLSSETITKSFRGKKIEAIKETYLHTFSTDYGLTFEVIGRRCYPSQTFDLPGGGTTTNKWVLYEFYKTRP